MRALGKGLFRNNFTEIFLKCTRSYPLKNWKNSEKNNSTKSILTNGAQRHSKIIPNPSNLLVRYTSCSSSLNQNRRGRHQYHEDIEKAMNQQILTEFNAAYTYLSMSAFFGKTDIALPGCQGFFYNMYLEEMEHAVVLMNYQLMRGGEVVLFGIEAPENNWGTVDKAFEAGLQLEQNVKEKICCLVEQANKHNDHQLVDFLTAQYLKEQNECIQEMGRFLTRAKKMLKDPNGEFLFDKLLFSNYVKDKNLMFLTQLPDKDDKNYK